MLDNRLKRKHVDHNKESHARSWTHDEGSPMRAQMVGTGGGVWHVRGALSCAGCSLPPFCMSCREQQVSVLRRRVEHEGLYLQILCGFLYVLLLMVILPDIYGYISEWECSSIVSHAHS